MKTFMHAFWILWWVYGICLGSYNVFAKSPSEPAFFIGALLIIASVFLLVTEIWELREKK